MRGVSAALPLLGKLRIGKFCLFGCFTDGTLVQMADGTTKPIEQIKQGDLVLSKDETTGIVGPKRVTGTSTNTVPNVETVNLADATGKIVESFTATADHPFYVEGQGFTAAYQMPVGTKVVTKSGILTVASTERHEAASGYVVHNFTVEDDHSYFVGNANGGAWVHNGWWCKQLHHIFPQDFKQFFRGVGINVHDYTVALSENVHLSGIHGRGGYPFPNGYRGTTPGNYNALWQAWIDANPGATRSEVVAFGRQMMRRFGLDGLPVVRYR